MKRIILPIDRALSGVGQLVLARPLVSGALLLTATALTICGNELWNASGSKTPLVEQQPAVVSIGVPTVALAPQMEAVTTKAQVEGKTTVASATVKTAAAGWQSLTIQPGDTLASLFKKNGLPAKEVATLSRLSGAKALHHLKLGQELRFYRNAAGQLQQLAYAVSDKNTLNIKRGENSTYQAMIEALPISELTLAANVSSAKNLQAAVQTTTEIKAKAADQTAKKSATNTSVAQQQVATASKTAASTPAIKYTSIRINRSLTADAKKAGLSAKQVNQLVQIFSQKNLAQNVRSGDEFHVLYETKANPSNKKAGANILAAQLTTRGKTYQLVRFADPKGHVEYYNPQGQSLKDGISRQPLDYDHISSYFSMNRLDPVTHYHRPHEGIDFAAPIGTPVQAAGDGVLAEVGYHGGYGNLVTIQHDQKYTTRYAHLSKFASNLRAGQSVRRGQVIGYVGQTGFATGPHLHYEIRINEVAANPLTVALPGATVPSIYRNQFFAQSKTLLAQLNTNRQIWLAQAKSNTSRNKG